MLIQFYKEYGLPDRLFYKSFWEVWKPQFLYFYLPLMIAGNANRIMGTTENEVVFWLAAIIGVANLLWLIGVFGYCIISDFLDKHKDD